MADRRVRLTLFVESDVKLSLERLSRETSVRQDADVTVSHLVRDAIAQYLARDPQRRALRGINERRGEYRPA